MKAELEVLFQTVYNLHKAIPSGDWVFYRQLPNTERYARSESLICKLPGGEVSEGLLEIILGVSVLVRVPRTKYSKTKRVRETP